MSSDAKIAAGLVLLAAVAFSYFSGGAGWNQDAQFDLTRALVERRTLHIDGYAVNTGDVTPGLAGHTYINKPPGASLLAAIPYAVVYVIEKQLHAPIDSMTRVNCWISTALSIGLCGALIGPVLFFHGRRRIGATPATALAVTLIILFGTIVFPYSTMLFAQVPTALFLLLAVTLLQRSPLAAGAAAGLALNCFLVCAVAVAFLLIVTLTMSLRTAVRFVIGLLPAGLLLAIYQWLCFGSPFRVSVATTAAPTASGFLFSILRRPSQDALYGITFSQYRGLFFASPVLLFVLAGAVIMARHKELRRELWSVVSIVAAFIFVIGSFIGWNGGCAFGARYLLPIIPLMGIPMFFAAGMAWRPVRALFIVAAALSFATNFIATATDPMPCPEVPNPISGYLIPAFFTGRIPEETRRAYTWYPTRSVDKIELARDSGNLGELVFGRRKRASLFPILIWLVAGASLLFREAARGRAEALT